VVDVFKEVAEEREVQVLPLLEGESARELVEYLLLHLLELELVVAVALVQRLVVQVRGLVGRRQHLLLDPLHQHLHALPLGVVEGELIPVLAEG